jgi:hypothetical protein
MARLILRFVPGVFQEVSSAARAHYLLSYHQVPRANNQTSAALIRDTIYIDGGRLYWSPGMDDGQYGAPEAESMSIYNYPKVLRPVISCNVQRSVTNLSVRPAFVERLVWSLNLSNPIDENTNVTTLLFEKPLKKPSNGLGANFQDGAMLANDDQFFLYGGVFQSSDAEYQTPDSDEVLSNQLFLYGAERTWTADWKEWRLSDKTDRYITYGGAANAPSENKAWYFSGMTSPTHGEINLNWNPDGKTFAQNVSNYFVEVDMAEQGAGVWTNSTLPSKIKGRANPEMVWVPVGEQGILVVLGGVVYPHWTARFTQSENPERSVSTTSAPHSESETDQDIQRRESPAFMKEIDIYDIAGNRWYKQTSTNAPGTRTRGCAVLATASDYSSFNIYYYGGFDGISPKDPFDDDVWVLSLPSFTWTRLNNGTEAHGRAGHKCFTPYADQMMAVGGYRSMAGTTIDCLNRGPFVFFNMSSGEWMDSYHPNEYADYGVPDKVVSVIGGDSAGGATLTTPSPSGWTEDDLGDVFAKTYDMAKISAWGPFSAAESPTGQPDPPRDDSDDNGGGGGLPSWVAPVLGVVLGLMVLTGALVVFFVWRKRRIFRNNPNAGSSDASTEDTGKRIIQWIKGQPAQQPVEKAPTVATSEETPASPETRSVSALKSDAYPSPPPEGGIFYETAGNPVAELPGEFYSLPYTCIDSCRSLT